MHTTLTRRRTPSPRPRDDAVSEDEYTFDSKFGVEFSTLENSDILEDIGMIPSMKKTQKDENSRRKQQTRHWKRGRRDPKRMIERSSPGYRTQQVVMGVAQNVLAANSPLHQLATQNDTSYDTGGQNRESQRSTSSWQATIERQGWEEFHQYVAREQTLQQKKAVEEQQKPKPVDVSFWK